MKIAVAQFSPKDGDKKYNLGIIENLARSAKLQGAKVIAFHEMCITAYTFTKDLSKSQLLALAEPIPNSASVKRLQEISNKYDIAILAGLLERQDAKIFNTYLCVYQSTVVATFRKLHPFINTHLSKGENYCVFNLFDWTCGILICYDNNIIENVRATTLLGAEIIFAPHVTGCTPSPMPGRGYVPNEYWEEKEQYPDRLRKEFDGPKGRGWLMRWLPARAYDNGIYYIFSNPIGYDGSHLKNGNAMIIDPFGDVLAETRSFDSEIAIAELEREKLQLAGGYRYRNARRPHLYRNILGADHDPTLRPVWLKRD